LVEGITLKHEGVRVFLLIKSDAELAPLLLHFLQSLISLYDLLFFLLGKLVFQGFQLSQLLRSFDDLLLNRRGMQSLVLFRVSLLFFLDLLNSSLIGDLLGHGEGGDSLIIQVLWVVGAGVAPALDSDTLADAEQQQQSSGLNCFHF